MARLGRDPMNGRALIAELLDARPDASDADIASEVLRRCQKKDLLPLVTAAVTHQRRHHTRSVERSVIVRRLGRIMESRSLPELIDDSEHREQLRALCRRAWRLGDRTLVEIGKATVDEIRQRLAMLRSQVAGFQESIRVLEQIEAELVRTGARCLDDLITEDAA